MNSIESQFERAHLLLAQQRYELALESYHAILSALPDDATAHAGAGLCLTLLERFEEAKPHHQTSIALEPDSGFVFYCYAIYLAARSHLPEAEQAIRTAIQFSPEEVDYHRMLAGILARQRRYADAREAVEQALGFDPVHRESLQLRALLAVREDAEIADAAVDAAMQVGPDAAESHFARALALLQQDEIDEAIVATRETLCLDPLHEGARRLLANCLRMNSPLYRKALVLPHALEIHMRNHCWIFSAFAGGVCWLLLWMAATMRSLDTGAPLLSFLFFTIYFAAFTGLPLSNLLVFRLRRDRKHLLPPEEFSTAYVILGLTVAALTVLLALSMSLPARMLALSIAAQIPAVSQIVSCKPGWPRRTMTVLAGLTALCGLTLAIGTASSYWVSPGYFDEPLALMRFPMYATCVLTLLVPFAAHYLTKARVRR